MHISTIVGSIGLLSCVRALSIPFGAQEVEAREVLVRGSVPVVDAINNIRSKTANLGAEVKKWSGNISDALPITAANAECLKAIQEGIRVAHETKKKFRAKKAIKIKKATKHLIKETSRTVEILLENRPKFVMAGLTKIVLESAEQNRAASSEFNKAVIAKLKIGKRIAKKLGRKADAQFKRLIDGLKQDIPAPPPPPN